MAGPGIGGSSCQCPLSRTQQDSAGLRSTFSTCLLHTFAFGSIADDYAKASLCTLFPSSLKSSFNILFTSCLSITLVLSMQLIGPGKNKTKNNS